MKLAYLAFVLDQETFDRVGIRQKLNPAGQNFHLKLAKAISSKHQVEVFAFFGEREEEVQASESLSFHYLPKVGKRQQIALLKDKLKGFDAILFDALSPIAAFASIKSEAPCLAIVTDAPFNISHVNFIYKKAALYLGRKADAYLCLTEGLNRLFNKKGKPSFIFPGIIEDEEVEPKALHKPYLYFDGALFERYGVGELVRAYKKFKPAYDLIIAGHGDMDEQLQKEEGITYLGQIGKSENYRYVKGSALSINPRPFEKNLDPYCVPSKLLEYFVFAKHVATTISTPLAEYCFESATILQPKPNDPTGIYNFFQTHIGEGGKLIKLKENNAKETLIERYSPEKIAQGVDSLLGRLK